MIEVISVLVMLGIITAYVATTSFDMIETSQSASEINQLKAHLKFAQIKSLNSNGNWGIDFNGATYALFRWDDPVPATIEYHSFPDANKIIINPTRDQCSVSKPDSGKYSTYSGYVWFDSLGRAYKNNIYSTAINTVPEISSNLTIVTTGGINVITVQKETGYVKCDF